LPAILTITNFHGRKIPMAMTPPLRLNQGMVGLRKFEDQKGPGLSALNFFRSLKDNSAGELQGGAPQTL
jgi:hypothetical protein